MRVILTYEYFDSQWYAHMEDYANLQITSRRGPWSTGVAAAQGFFEQIACVRSYYSEIEVDEFLGG